MSYGDVDGGFAPEEAQPIDPLIQLLAGIRPAPAALSQPPGDPSAAPAPPPLYAQPANPNWSPAPVSPVGVAPAPMPKPPTYQPVDLAKRAQLTQALNDVSQPTDPNDPNAKARWFDRLLGGLVGFGRGYVHDPNAIEEGGAVTNRRYNTAEALRGGKQRAAETALGEFDKSAKEQGENYQGQSSQFEHEMQGIREQREQKVSDATVGLKGAQAERWASMSPEERRQQIPDIEQTLGRPLDPDEKENFILYGKPEKKAGNGKPKTVQEGLFSDDPDTRSRAEGLFNKEHPKGSGDGTPGQKPAKPATKGEFLSVQRDRNKAWDKADADYQKEHDEQVQPKYDAAHREKDPAKAKTKLEVAQAADKQATDRLFKSKQSAQDDYENGIGALGGSSKHVDVNTPNAPASSTPTKPPTPSTPAAKPAQASTAPPPQAFVKGPNVVHTFKNPSTGKPEQWKLVNGKAVKVGG